MYRYSVGGFRERPVPGSTTNETTTDYPLAALAGCSAGGLSHSELFVAELIFSFFVLFIAYGLALDARQAAITGPVGAPIFIAIGICAAIFATGGHDDSGLGGGPQMNLAVCLASSAAAGAGTNGISWDPTFGAYFTGELVAALLHAALYYLAPPHHAEHGLYVPALLREKREAVRLEEKALGSTKLVDALASEKRLEEVPLTSAGQ